MTFPTLYQFADISHHNRYDQKIITGQQLADRGHRIAVHKASDSYHMPDKDGKYNFSENRHHDAFFVDAIRSYREAGLGWAGYHFARFDRPAGTRAKIVQANFDYYMASLQMLVEQGVLTQEELDNVNCTIIDFEQHGTQIEDAGLGKRAMSSMTKDITEPFLERFENVIIYSASWWTDQYLTDSAQAWMAERTACWEAEYYGIKGAEDNYMPIRDVEYLWDNYFKPQKAYKKEWATSADDIKGKIFTWQYTSSGRITPPGAPREVGLDLNLTAMSKGELFKMLGTDGSVDPPPPPPPPNGGGVSDDEILAAIEKLDEKLTQLQASLDASTVVGNETLSLTRGLKDILESM